MEELAPGRWEGPHTGVIDNLGLGRLAARHGRVLTEAAADVARRVERDPVLGASSGEARAVIERREFLRELAGHLGRSILAAIRGNDSHSDFVTRLTSSVAQVEGNDKAQFDPATWKVDRADNLDEEYLLLNAAIEVIERQDGAFKQRLLGLRGNNVASAQSGPAGQSTEVAINHETASEAAREFFAQLGLRDLIREHYDDISDSGLDACDALHCYYWLDGAKASTINVLWRREVVVALAEILESLIRAVPANEAVEDAVTTRADPQSYYCRDRSTGEEYLDPTNWMASFDTIDDQYFFIRIAQEVIELQDKLIRAHGNNTRPDGGVRE